ncbi:MAG: sulfatase-like hydrolase/transferase [Verrucomicrobiales bacterium]|nr:sulfatase-like hydrolase/transferase [Verrucomicrobiales bacterium]
MQKFASLTLQFALLLVLSISVSFSAEKPNVVIVITDDQGYGDLSCHGNPILKTPHIDKLAGESIRLEDYHVAPTCSPTRCAFLTGHWTNRTGVWHTIMGRSMLRENEVTIGQIFQDNGYATGMFGKWHLGDNYPFRPEDRGFTEVLRHGGGGVGQTPDYWDNAYFDGSYFHNSKPVPAKGFCTDVFFDYAKRFIEKQVEEDKPFLAYISTNAPHGPMHAPEEYAKPYEDQGLNTGLAHFFGMIANIDDNVGQMRKWLAGKGLEENTIFIFTTDNGTSSGSKVHNSGMRGQKGSEYDGGHRVPFFLHWPAGGFQSEQKVGAITAHVDVVPTLIDLCEVEAPAEIKFDGVSIRPLLESKSAPSDWPDRILVTDSQRVKDPIKWRKSSVMTTDWRLVSNHNGKGELNQELYQIKEDPGQEENVIADHPEVAERLKEFYNNWWDEIAPTFGSPARIKIGHPAENPSRLTSHDWISDNMVPWNQQHIRSGDDKPQNTGFWYLDIVEAGDYEITLRRWPDEGEVAKKAITDPVAPGDPVPGTKAFRVTPGRAIAATKATIDIAGKKLETEVSAGASSVTFDLSLSKGPAQLAARFLGDNGEVTGAFYAYVKRK